MSAQQRRAIVWDGLKSYPYIEYVDVYRFARRFNVSTRTVYRDIAALKASGLQVPPFFYRERPAWA